MAESAYPCKWASCTTICASDQALFEHLLQDHGSLWHGLDVNHRLACQWTGCKIKPPRQWLKTHLISHTDYRPFLCKVSPSCTKNFKTSHGLRNHLKSKNHHRPPTIEPTPSCEWTACTKTLVDPPALLDHISKFHSSKGAEDICLWTECAHRSALKWKFDSCLPSWYEPILSEEDELGKPLLTHAHAKWKNRTRKGGLGTKGDAVDELQVQAKRRRAQVPGRDDPESEDDNIAYMEDLEDGAYALVRQTSGRGAKRLRESHGEDEGEDLNVGGRLGAGEWNVRDRVMAPENINSTGTPTLARKPQPLKVRTDKSDKDVTYEDEDYAPTPSLSRSPSPNWMSAFENGADSLEDIALAYQDAEHDAKYASSTGQSPSPRWIYGFETAASSPTVVTPVQEQEYASTAVHFDDSKPKPGSNVKERVRTFTLLVRKNPTAHSHTSLSVAGRRRVTNQEPGDAARAALSVIRQSKVLRVEWSSQVSEGTVMFLDQDPQTDDDWSIWETGAL